MDIKAADGSSKHGVLYTVDDEETLIILDNISSAEDLEKIEEEIQNAKDSDLIDAQEVEDLD